MKFARHVLLFASVLLNFALLVLLLMGLAREPATAVRAVSAPRIAPPVSPPAYDANTWSSLQTTDRPALVARLREAGFPPAVVRAIIQAQLEDEYRERRRALEPNAGAGPYWKNENLDPKAEMALREFSREKQKRLRELLGPEAEYQDPLSRMRQDRHLSFLPAEKAEQVRQVMREFEMLRRDTYMNTVGGMMGTAEREMISALEKRQNAEIARRLSPAEFAEYELRGSNTAKLLRSRLPAFDATEDEFRMMFRIAQQYDDIAGPTAGMPGVEDSRRRRDAQRQMDELIKATLGPVRAAEYARASNFEYTRTSQLVARLELPPETTNRLWNVQQEYQKRAQAVYADRALAPEERNRQLAGLVVEATGKLEPLLGSERALAAYRQNTYWMHGLIPPPPPPGR